VGFVSKWVVHPEQIETATRVFTPTAPELDEARRILELLDTAAAGRGATTDGTSMVDEASRRAALGVLARADER
jgi:citrate lyase subunit beta/citryl-CoA lyase